MLAWLSSGGRIRAGLPRAPTLRAQNADFHQLHAIQYARENEVPFSGIRLVMQGATIEYARNVCGLERADSTAFEHHTPRHVTHTLRELLGVGEMSGTMRLGAWPCRLEPGSSASPPWQPLKRAAYPHRIAPVAAA